MWVLIPPDDSARLLVFVLRQLDLTPLYEAYNAYRYGAVERIYSSRALAKACGQNINFMWLLQGNAAGGTERNPGEQEGLGGRFDTTTRQNRFAIFLARFHGL
jgi:hypothetical protein